MLRKTKKIRGKIWSCRFFIKPEFNGCYAEIHNGRSFIRLRVIKEKVGLFGIGENADDLISVKSSVGNFTVSSGTFAYALLEKRNKTSLRSCIAEPWLHIFPKRQLCTSGESSDLDSGTLTERWSDQVTTLNSISSSLKEGGLVRENHFTELNRVGRGLSHDEIPDLEWVIKDAAEARSLENAGVDPVSPQVQHALSKIEVARNAAHFLENDSFILSKDPLKRDVPGEGEARAAELHRLLEDRIIPAVSDVIVAYRDLRQAAASLDSDSENSMNSDADSGGGEGE